MFVFVVFFCPAYFRFLLFYVTHLPRSIVVLTLCCMTFGGRSLQATWKATRLVWQDRCSIVLTQLASTSSDTNVYEPLGNNRYIRRERSKQDITFSPQCKNVHCICERRKSQPGIFHWLRRLPRERMIPGSNPACAESHASDLKNGHSSGYPAMHLAL